MSGGVCEAIIIISLLLSVYPSLWSVVNCNIFSVDGRTVFGSYRNEREEMLDINCLTNATYLCRSVLSQRLRAKERTVGTFFIIRTKSSIEFLENPSVECY